MICFATYLCNLNENTVTSYNNWLFESDTSLLENSLLQIWKPCSLDLLRAYCEFLDGVGSKIAIFVPLIYLF